MNKIGQIPYINARAFFYGWDKKMFPTKTGSPRELARAAKRGDIIAGPLPVVEGWALKTPFEPLGHWGISVQHASRSVFVVSKVPFDKINATTLGATEESSSSVYLAQVLIQQKYGNRVTVRRGFHTEDKARLVIGDKALKFWESDVLNEWPYVTDLATEWWVWKKLPFVFAQWIVRRDLEPAKKKKLSSLVDNSLHLGLSSLVQISIEAALDLNLPAEKVMEYLSGFTYELGDSEKESIRIFKECCDQSMLLADPRLEKG